jgi:eukaryotic-like serine/threonine-protein kinase
MVLTLGSRLGPYEILLPLGAGGMGEVYRARDTKLGRDVALKVLPEAFAKNGERMARFRREAQVLASLNHPNIATIYGLEESNGTCALVMELVEGPTLAERIAGKQPLTRPASGGPPSPLGRGAGGEGLQPSPLPLDEALPIAKQIAEGLEYAHERGIIHRDLKPANVKVRPDGTVKILDFGLAKALEETPAAASINTSPTISAAATREGIILGTAAYMSPEQARGKTVDRRCDIWSFGALLFEMLSGKQAFAGEDVSHTLAAVIMKDPDWSALPATTPASIQRLVRRCLSKDPKQRLRDIGDARIAIEETLAGSPDVGAVREPPLQSAPTPIGRRALPWALAAVLALVLVALIIGNTLRQPLIPTRPIARLLVNLPPADHLALGLTPVLAMSPDGTRLVYVGNRGGSRQLYVRPLDRFEATPIPGTEGAETPFFSPDGQWVGFFADGKLKKVSLSGGVVMTLCSAPENRGASWGPDDTIIFAPSITLGLFRVSAAGGTPRPLTFLDRKKGDLFHRWPEILPGNRAALFTISTGGSSDKARIGVLSLETGETTRLVEGGTYARYVPSGHLVYARAGELLAVPFDLKRLEVTGPPVTILKGVSMHPIAGAAQFSFSGDGSLAYVPGGSKVGERTLVWVDRDGAPQPLPAPQRPYLFPRLSPDGQRLAVSIQGANSGLWVYDLGRGTLSRLTESILPPRSNWTPDGKHVTFASAQSGAMDLYWTPADGSGAVERLTTSENFQVPGSWSPDGQVLAFSEADPTTGWDIWMLRLQGDRKPRPFLQTPANESGPLFSPDGHSVAYGSDESGRNEIYVRPFPGPGGKMQISSDGGTEPMWARNGRELFYRNGDKMMVTAVETQPVFAASRPKLLFEGHYETGIGPFEAGYDVSPDGQKFLMIKASEQEPAATQLNVVLNWSDELRRLAPAGKP